MRRTPRRSSVLAAALLLAWAAAAAQAYVIILKDGSRLVAQKKYRVAGGRAIFTLESGTETFVPAGEIDVERTEAANKVNYRDAVVLRDAVPEAPGAAPTRRRPLGDLAARTAPPPREPAARRSEPRAEAAPRTGAGYADFMSRDRRPHSNLELAAELQQLYRGQGVEEVQVFAGTRGDRPFVEVTTNSEAAVLQALTASANALVQLRQRLPGRVAALELLMATPARERAGQFVMNPEMAAELASKKIEATAFFVQNVQF